jgi:hypothetical protein
MAWSDPNRRAKMFEPNPTMRHLYLDIVELLQAATIKWPSDRRFRVHSRQRTAADEKQK